ncbi:DUF1992 domain-containing protein [candidate division KSB1 bacterium]|nr:DUF1992 domain-containing protein [candidate division KSB1 bacterium]
MYFLSRLVEEKIKQAIAEGEFDNLPGHGKPLVLEDFSEVPEHMRMAYKVLKNAGVLPLEVELRKEIAALRQQLDACNDEAQQQRLRKELNDKSLKYNLLMERNQRRQQ